MASKAATKQNKRLKWSLGMLLIITCFSIIYLTFSSTESKETSNSYEPSFNKNGQLAIIKEHSADTSKVIEIELADTDEKRMQGMMWRRSMKEHQGMFFIFDKEEQRSFWMKNTFIPLDIIYINSLMEIVSIRHNAKPLEEWSIPSEYPAQYVLEVIGGFCYTYNIETGDRIQIDLNKD